MKYNTVHNTSVQMFLMNTSTKLNKDHTQCVQDITQSIFVFLQCQLVASKAWLMFLWFCFGNLVWLKKELRQKAEILPKPQFFLHSVVQSWPQRMELASHTRIKYFVYLKNITRQYNLCSTAFLPKSIR